MVVSHKVGGPSFGCPYDRNPTTCGSRLHAALPTSPAGHSRELFL